MPEISVIVPVYNTEKYICQCVDSIVAQTFRDFEVLLIDDCSPDRCGAICEKYALKDNRVKVIHHEKNMGLSMVRNTGITNAQGRWIMFVDSDDWIEKDALLKLSEYLMEDTELVVFGMVQDFEDKEGLIRQRKYLIPSVMKARSPIEIGHVFAYLEGKRCFQYTCNKVYKSCVLKSSHVEFENIELMEDFVFNARLWCHFKSVSTVDYVPYHYRRFENGGTLALKYSPVFFELSKMRYQTERNILTELAADTSENIYQIQYVFLKHLISLLARNSMINSPLSFKENYRLTKQIVKDEDVRVFFKEFQPRGFKIKLITLAFKIKIVFLLQFLGKLAGNILIKG